MNPSRLFILRPVATSLLMVAIFLSGLIAYRQLALSALPEVDYPTMQVTTFYPGASPDVVASAITASLRDGKAKAVVAVQQAHQSTQGRNDSAKRRRNRER